MEAAKRALRSAQRRRMADLSLAAKRAASAAAAAAILASDSWRRAAGLFAFVSLPDEIDTAGLLAAAAAQGKTVAVPRVVGSGLEFRQWRPGAADWPTGPLGVREPPADARLIEPDTAAGPLLALVPGLAFDASGRRLGRGKGYYDRWLRRARRVRPDLKAIGYGFAEHLVAEVPSGPDDEKLDGFCCAGRLVDCPRRADENSLSF